ncbi:U-box domain-containing protein 43-like [Andrographis paniculata]|uniref:U-box domain-containing protein 43-like n=1 Tax=Andrographis paniculata TaxID=175694 RepID=UPI0021E86EC9|nr:U-box domain-containing protein 43-like [Andrographis paniculata]XP_051147181.1 U-box domain-containing protein 43-like [Andrographis paniculata]
MVMDVITNSSLDPLMDCLSQIVQAIIELILASENVLVEKKSFSELSSYLHRIVPLLNELNKKGMTDSEGLTNFMEILDHALKEANKLVKDCSERNRFYLFVNSRSIAKQIGHITKEIIRAINCIPFASLDISLKIREDIGHLISSMQAAEFQTAVAEEEILQKIESGIQKRNVDCSYANNLLVSIAKAIGVSTDRSALRREFDDFKSEIDSLRLRKDKAETIQMDQIIALLERADVALSIEDREKKYLTKREALGTQPLEPLVSFYCPITNEVMVDPVETPSGHTFERSAIEKWLSESKEPLCPFTSNPLDTSMLRPNKTLRQSIEEWKERNAMISIAALKSKLSSGEEDEVLHCLEQLRDLCEQREIHREWLVLDNYLLSLVELLRVRNRDVRAGALRVLCLLTKENEDAKGRISKVENSIQLIVQLLARSPGERKLAVALLLELSKSELIRECIGKFQGCILLLVTMLNSTDDQAATDAQKVLENLSYSDDNVILMANNNYFKYLLERLASGSESDHVKKRMAKTLGDMELTDHNKSLLVESGVLDLLLVLVSHNELEMKQVAIRALLNLSKLKRNGQQIIKKGAVHTLLDILYRQTSSQSLRELAAATIMHLALSTIPEDSDLTPVPMLDSDEDIAKLFSLISLTGPDLQQKILRALHALSLSPSADMVKSKLKECAAVQMLFRLVEGDDANLRASAVKLLGCLTEEGDEAAVSEHVTKSSVETLLKILTTSGDDDEISSTLGIIANLPKSAEISRWLLESGDLQTVFNFLDSNGSISGRPSHKFIEDAVGAICRLTIKTSLELQKKVADAGVIPLLVNLLQTRSRLTIKRAATCLAQLSESSPQLSRQMSRRPKLWCFSAIPEAACPVHMGVCTVASSFCLLEAAAVGPLVEALGNADPTVCESALDALLTLMSEERLQRGCKVLGEAGAVPAIISLLSSPSPGLQEKVLNCVERIFRQVEYKQRYGALANMPLVDLTQRGNARVRSLAARALARLSMLHEQSSFF